MMNIEVGIIERSVEDIQVKRIFLNHLYDSMLPVVQVQVIYRCHQHDMTINIDSNKRDHLGAEYIERVIIESIKRLKSLVDFESLLK